MLGCGIAAAACGGSDFTAEAATGGAAGSAGFDAGGAGGVDASSGGASGGAGAGTGGASSGGTGSGGTGSGGSGPACDAPLTATDCNNLSTGSVACDDCGRTNCCSQVDTCLADAQCKRLLSCMLAACKNKDPISCGAASCSICLGSLGLFTQVSGCLQQHCNDPCPFKPGPG